MLLSPQVSGGTRAQDGPGSLSEFPPKLSPFLRETRAGPRRLCPGGAGGVARGLGCAFMPPSRAAHTSLPGGCSVNVR